MPSGTEELTPDEAPQTSSPNPESTASALSSLKAARGLPARNLSVVAFVLFVLFATVVAGALIPLRLLDPVWQLSLSAVLVNAAPFPLLGLALLQLAAAFSPHDNLLKRRQRSFSRLALAAALGFLLLIPLQTVAGLSQNRTITNAQSSRIKLAESKLSALRQVVASAGSNAELNQALQNLQGPVLGPADLAQPLPMLKAQVGAVLDQAEQQIARERRQAPPPSRWLLLPDLLRQAVSCLALAIGFAALSQRAGSPFPLWSSLQLQWQRWSRKGRSRPKKPSKPQKKTEWRPPLRW